MAKASEGNGKNAAGAEISACPVCGAGGGVPLLEVAASPVLHVMRQETAIGPGHFAPLAITVCERCGHVYNAKYRSIDERALGAGLLTNAIVHPTMTEALRETVEFALAGREDAGDVLEVGCGAGDLARLLARRARSIVLVEPACAGQDVAFTEPNVTLLAEPFPVSSLTQRFDLAVCRQVLEHVAEPRAFLDALRARLKDGAEAYLEVPRFEYIEEAVSPADLHFPHVQYYRRGILLHLFERAGFEVVGQRLVKHGHDIGFRLRAVRPGSAPPPGPRGDPPALRRALSERIAAGARVLGRLPRPLALYGACAYSQSLLGLYPGIQGLALALDDTPAYRGTFVYGPALRVPVQNASEAPLCDLGTAIVSAYLHDQAIAERLRAAGFAGEIVSMRTDALAGYEGRPPSLFGG